jgi:hypothetical protein
MTEPEQVILAAAIFRDRIWDALFYAVDMGLSLDHLDVWMHRIAFEASLDDDGRLAWDTHKSAIEEYRVAVAASQPRSGD